MKSLETSQDKIEKICETIRKETILPAKEEASRIIEEAKKEAQKIMHEARKEYNSLIESAAKEIEQERNVFQSSLVQASKQGMEALRQDIEHKLFNSQLDNVLEKELKNPNIIASIIKAVIIAIEKDGLEANLQAAIAEGVSSKEVNELLGKEVLNRLKENSVTVGSFKGGAQIKVIDRKMSIDISEDAIKELVASYIRKDFRKLFFNV